MKNQPEFVKRDASVPGKEYMTLLAGLKEQFCESQIKTAVKVNTALLEFYWNMGREVSCLYATAKYGSAIFDCLSLDLKAKFRGQTGLSATNIRYIKQWYEFYNQEIVNCQRVVDDLQMPANFGLIPWAQHIDIFTKSRSVSEALFYIEQSIKNNWSQPELNAEIEKGLYDTQVKAIPNFDDKLPAPLGNLAKEILKSPYDFGFIDKRISEERVLEDALASDITRFLLELGQGFAYVGHKMELRTPGGQTFMPDMIFYHTRLKCYVVCELKVTDFKPEYAGKLNFYVSAVDELMKQDDDNPTIGLLICKSKDNTIVEWSFRGISQTLEVEEYKLKQYIDDRLATLLPSETDIKNMIDNYSEGAHN